MEKPKFKIEKEPPQQIFVCNRLYVDDMIDEIINKKGKDTEVSLEEDFFPFCEPINEGEEIKDLVDENRNITNVKIQWSKLLTHLYTKFGKDLSFIPSMLMNRRFDEEDD